MLGEAQELEHDDDDDNEDEHDEKDDEDEDNPDERWEWGSAQASCDRMKRRCGSSHDSIHASSARWKMERGGVTRPLRRDRRFEWWDGALLPPWWGPGGTPREWW